MSEHHDQSSRSESSSSAPRGGESRLSALAVVALVLALIPMCPPVNLLAVALGMLAYRRIVMAGGRLRGQGLARAAIVSGFLLCLFSLMLLGNFAASYQQRTDDDMRISIEQVIKGAADQRVSGVMANWSASRETRPEDDAILEFGTRMTERYGEFKHLNVISFTKDSILTQRRQAAVIFHFANEQLNGYAELELVNQPFDFFPLFRVRSIVIEDPVLGDLTLPSRDNGP